MASGGAVARLAKPKLKGHFNDWFNKTFLYSTIVGVVATLGYYGAIVRPHELRRERLFAERNPDKEFERLRDLGFFWSVPSKTPDKALYHFEKED